MQEVDLRRWAAPFYLSFLHGNFLGPDYEKIQPGFKAQLCEALDEITPEVVEELLYDDNWRVFECGGWFAALKNWSEFDIQIGRTLVKRANICRLQGLSMARFGTHYGAACLRGYLNATLRSQWSIGEEWTVGALCHLDAKLGTQHAADYLVPLAQHAAKIEAHHQRKEVPPLSSASPWDYAIAEFEQVIQRLNNFAPEKA